MEYVSLDTLEYYSSTKPLVEGLGFLLVDVKVKQVGKTKHISVVISAKDTAKSIGVDDCAKVHHALLPRFEAILGTDDIYMELTSPGIERNVKNAAEFSLFLGKMVRVWDKTKSDWVSGKITASDEKSVWLDGVCINYENIAKAKLVYL